MKRFVCLVCSVFLLVGCSGVKAELDRVMALRAKILASQGVSFDVGITADYGDKSYTFSMNCKGDPQGNLSFTVTEPNTIAGITGTVAAKEGKLTFGDSALAFELMADGQVSPVSGPWLLHKALSSGYLTSCTMEDGLFRVAIDDSYADDALHLDIWLNSEDQPVRGEILWQGRRIVSMDIKNFAFL